MGTFLTNIHVYSEREKNDEVLLDVSNSLRNMAKKESYIEAKDNEFADRTIIVSATQNPKWFVILDEDSESQDIRILESISETVSQISQISALYILIHDSDYLQFGLYKDGCKRDSSTIRNKMNRKGLNKKHWTGILSNSEIIELGNQLKQNKTFADDFLQIIADFLHLDKKYCFSGYRSLEELPIENFVKLRFKFSEQIKFLQYNKGLPYLYSPQREIRYPIQIGKRTNLISTVINKGGENVGLTAFILIENDLLKKVKFHNVRICPFSSNHFEENFQLIEHLGNNFLMANFNKVVLGPSHKYTGSGMMTPFEHKIASRSLDKQQFYGTVLVEPLKIGNIEIKILYAPHRNPQKGVVMFTFHMEVVEKLDYSSLEPKL